MGFSGGVRAEKRRTFQEKAGAAFDALFDEDQQEQLITLKQREDRVLQKGAELQAWLLEQHLQSDPLADPVVVEALCCPKCRRLGVRDEEEKEAVARPLTTRAGKQELWRYSRKPTAQSRSLRYDAASPRKVGLENRTFDGIRLGRFPARNATWTP